jgi:tyrosine-protein kinase Etk/Wzc
VSAPAVDRPLHPAWISFIRRTWGRRGTVALFAAGAFVASAAFMLVVPEKYRAHCVLLPPPQDTSTGFAAAMLAQSGIDQLIGMGTGSVSSELYVEILGSRSVADGVIDSLGLLSDFGLSAQPRELAMERVRTVLLQRVTFRASTSGVVTITAVDQTGYFPKFRPAAREKARRRSAEIANAYCTELDRVNLAHSVSRAKASRTYLENQIALASADRDRAAKTLLEFQTTHGAISMEDQTRMVIETAGDLKSQILSKRVELGLVLRTENESSPRARGLRNEIEELQHQYDGIEKGMWESVAGGRKSPASTTGEDKLAPPMTELPDLAFRYASLLRELKTQEALTDILTQQFYEAKLQEARDITTLHVLDRATPPVHRQAPRRSRTVAMATVLGGLLGLVVSWSAEEWRRLRLSLRASDDATRS